MKPFEAGLMELRAALDAGELSSAELMAATLARIDRLNPSRNAIVARLDPDPLMKAAREADDAASRAGREGKGPAALATRLLHGIPQASKDTTASRDIVTTWGSPVFATHLPPADHVMVARMRAAGAIFIGKTNVPEFGYGSHSVNPVYGATGNAFAPALSAGGSSGGAAVAVATGMLAVADGSDVMGSLRNPAAFNRVLGLRPSAGLVPNLPSPEVFLPNLHTCGPIARSVADLSGLLSVQAGGDPGDPWSLPGDGQPFADLALALSRSDGPDAAAWLAASGGLRIGWLGDLDGHLAMEAGIIQACESALAVFEGLGAAVETCRLGMSPAEIWESWLTARSFQIAGAQAETYGDPAKRALIKPEAIWEIERGLDLKAADVHRASVVRTTFLRHWLALFDDFDFLALPSAQVRPFPNGIRWPEAIAGRSMDTYHRWMEVVLYPTLAGSPAISLPVPGADLVGVQLIGAPGADRQVIEAAAAYQLATVGFRGWSEGLALEA